MVKNASIRSVSLGGPLGTDSKNPSGGDGGSGSGGAGGGDLIYSEENGAQGVVDVANGERRPLIGDGLSTTADDKIGGGGGGGSWMPRMFK